MVSLEKFFENLVLFILVIELLKIADHVFMSNFVSHFLIFNKLFAEMIVEF